MTSEAAAAPDESVIEPLRAARLLTSAGAEQARAQQRQSGGYLGDALLRLNLVKEVDFLRTFSALYQTRFVKADKAVKVSISPEALERLQVRTAERIHVLPLLWNKDAAELHLLATIPLPTEIDTTIRTEAKARKVVVYVATPGVIAALIRRWYYGDPGALGEVTENGAGPTLVQVPKAESAPDYPTDGKTVVVQVEPTQTGASALVAGGGDLTRHLPAAVLSALGDSRPMPRTAETVVLFADLKGFTQFSDHQPAVEVVRILNLALDTMVKVVFEHGGTLDKFVGDRVMALWGAPDLGGANGDPATLAVRAALDIADRIPALDTGVAPLRVCVGVHCGDAVAGFVGPEFRREFTAVGSTVNVASRLCEMAVENQVLATQAILDRVERGLCQGAPYMFMSGLGAPLMTFALRRL